VSRVSINSILILDAVNTQSVFAGLKGVSCGMSLIASGVMSSAKMDDVEILRYAMSLIHLSNQLQRDDERFSKFAQRIERLSAVDEDQLLEACSEVYKDFISELRPQIIVQGEQGFLQSEFVPNKVRTLLLAGIRACVLWQQVGGSRFRLLWERRKYQLSAQELLN
jgi:high frequency lysogenization protein